MGDRDGGGTAAAPRTHTIRPWDDCVRVKDRAPRGTTTFPLNMSQGGGGVMTFQEKRNIAIGLENTPSMQLEEIINIIHANEPLHATRNVDKTWDIDLARLSDITLRLIKQVIHRSRSDAEGPYTKSEIKKTNSSTPKLLGNMAVHMNMSSSSSSSSNNNNNNNNNSKWRNNNGCNELNRKKGL